MNHINKNIKSVTAFAPATCGNAILGFDIMGLAMGGGLGDEVTLNYRDDQRFCVQVIDGNNAIPLEPDKNIASAVLITLLKDLHIDTGFDVLVKKGIPLASGMGGSAASAVAALVACNRFLEKPLTLSQLASYALQGEALCSGQAHPDNIVPALYGGLTLITQTHPVVNVLALPIPEIICVLVHPHWELPTREARQVLAPTVPLHTHVLHCGYLAEFISILYRKDWVAFTHCLQDVVIEPQRQALVSGFLSVKQAALEAKALGVSLSGAGPSLLAWALNMEIAEKVGQAMQAAFLQQQLESEVYLSPISSQGAIVKSVEEHTHVVP